MALRSDISYVLPSLRVSLSLKPQITALHLVQKGSVADPQSLGGPAAIPLMAFQCSQNDVRLELLRGALYLLPERHVLLDWVKIQVRRVAPVSQLGDDLVRLTCSHVGPCNVLQFPEIAWPIVPRQGPQQPGRYGWRNAVPLDCAADHLAKQLWNVL